jgi:hypothetical protein
VTRKQDGPHKESVHLPLLGLICLVDTWDETVVRPEVRKDVDDRERGEVFERLDRRSSGGGRRRGSGNDGLGSGEMSGRDRRGKGGRRRGERLLCGRLWRVRTAAAADDPSKALRDFPSGRRVLPPLLLSFFLTFILVPQSLENLARLDDLLPQEVRVEKTERSVSLLEGEDHFGDLLSKLWVGGRQERSDGGEETVFFGEGGGRDGRRRRGCRCGAERIRRLSRCRGRRKGGEMSRGGGVGRE